MRRVSPSAVLLLLPLAVAAAPELSEGLPQRYREWLDRVHWLIQENEREYFLRLSEDFRRNAFIDAFWLARDPDPLTRANELRVIWDERGDEALVRYDSLADARSELYLLHGDPYQRCLHRTREIEIWTYYLGPPDVLLRNPEDYVTVLVYQAREGEPYVHFRPPAPFIWRLRSQLPNVPLRETCSDGQVDAAVAESSRLLQRDIETSTTIHPPTPSAEWVASFAARTTDLPEGAATFDAELLLDYPGRHQQRTVLQAVLRVDPAAVATVGDGADARRQLLLLGEVVRGDEIFDSFRYRFELPVGAADERPLAVVAQRYLRPGPARLLLRLEDLFGRRFARIDQQIEVPSVAAAASGELGPGLEESQLLSLLVEADEATARGERSIQLLDPESTVVTGLQRFHTVIAGEFSRVDFSLDGKVIFSKRQPPYSVELDLGALPALHRLRVDGYDLEGEIGASDELLLNPGGQRFRVHLSEPRTGGRYRSSLRAATQIVVPEGETLDRLELFLDEERVAVLYQEPWVQPIVLRDDGLAYVRAVAYLDDGSSAEDLVFINAPGELEQIQVNFVELFATVFDRRGRPVPGLSAESFRVLEDDVPQQARRFEWVDNLPLHALLLIDTSASMEESLERVGEAARRFVEEVVEPRDRVSVVTFDDRPRVAAGFTNDLAAVAAELAALRPGGGTALYDSLVFALHSFYGVRGQKALVLLSDGKDEASGFGFDATREFARRAGVTLYAIGLRDADWSRAARRLLTQLAEETGGRSFFVRSLDELPAIYASIQEELRSQYLFAYQSTSTRDPSEFRVVEVTVEVDGEELEVRAIAGYYP